MAETIEIKVPDIGDFDQVDVVEVLVKPGDSVAVDDSLITLESDKASMEVPSPSAGVVREVLVAVGDQVGEGAVIVRLEASEPSSDEGSAAESPAPATPPAQAPMETSPAEASSPETRVAATSGKATSEKEPPSTEPEPPAPREAPRGSSGTTGAIYASPSVRRFARELGADLSSVPGSGRKGRILKEDVQQWVKAQLQGSPAETASGGGAGFEKVPPVDWARYGGIEVRPLSRIRRASARNLHRAWLNVPHVTQFDEADVTELEEFRQSLKSEAQSREVRLTPVAFQLLAAAKALREFPEFNSSLDPSGESLIVKDFVHIGVAVDTPDGLVVPVIRDVDKKGLWELAAELVETSERAREGRLSIPDLQGAGFSISSLGGIGGTGFTPIVNAPEVAILGIARMDWKPVWQGSEFVPRRIMPFSVSYDHRVIDGAQGVRFTTFLSGLLGDIRRLLL